MSFRFLLAGFIRQVEAIRNRVLTEPVVTNY